MYLQALARSANLKAFLCSVFIQSERYSPGSFVTTSPRLLHHTCSVSVPQGVAVMFTLCILTTCQWDS